MPRQSAQDLIRANLEDAIAAESAFETQLRDFANDGSDPVAQQLFSEHADETKEQYERLTARLEELGGSTAMGKTMFGHIPELAPKTGGMGGKMAERVAQNLIVAYTVENAEVAMYEALAAIAGAAGDSDTEQLAKEIQEQERETAELILEHLPAAARRAFKRMTGREAFDEVIPKAS